MPVTWEYADHPNTLWATVQANQPRQDEEPKQFGDSKAAGFILVVGLLLAACIVAYDRWCS